MDTDPPVIVVFRKWRDNGDILALFPEIPHNDRLCTAYEHVGQHGGADYAGCIARTVPATPTEYAALRRELKSAPYHYKLIIRKRYTRRLARA